MPSGNSPRRPLVFGLTLLLTTLAMVAPVGASQEALKVVFIAYQNPDQLLENVEPVVAYLEQVLGIDVEYFAATDYAGVVEALRYERADVGFMGPLQYVIAHREAGARPILGEVYDGSPTYVSRLFVRKDSGLKTPADLHGKTIAFVDPLSSSGYLYPLDIFKRAGLIEDAAGAGEFFRKIYFAGGEEQAIRAVLNGFVDAAGIGQYSFSLLRGEERDQVISIADSRSIPSHGVVVRRGLDPQVADAFRDALLALNEGPNRGLLEHLYSVDGYVVADDDTYREVEELAIEYGLIKP